MVKKEVNDKEKLKNFHSNMDAMSRVLGEPLHNFKRKLEQDKGENDFARKLKREHSAVYEAAVAHLPSSSTLSSQMKQEGGAPLKEDTVDKIAKFCSDAFAFVEAVTRTDLLTRELHSFPHMYLTGQWERYGGLYRCFYFYPDRKKAAELHAGLLRLWEKNGKFHAFLVTGLHRDRYVQELERIMEQIPERHLEKDLYSKCKEYSDGHHDGEMRLVMYQGVVQTTLSKYFLMQLPRCGGTNMAVLVLRRRDGSAQNDYSGGLAAVTLCRSANITAYPMAVVRHKLSLGQDRDFLEEYLRAADNGEKGFRLSEEKEAEWNQELMARIRDQAERE